LRERIKVRGIKNEMQNALQVTLAKELRAKQTEAEKILWFKLRKRQLHVAKFRRQQRIGSYIVDFVCLEKRLIIEIDGGQHNEAPIKENDEQRTRWLEAKGYQIFRFWNNDIIQNTDGVLEKIREVLIQRFHPHLASPFRENLHGEPVEGEEKLGGR